MKLNKICFSLALLSVASMANAGLKTSLGDVDVSVDGFGTFGVVRTNSDQAQFTVNSQQRSGAEKSPSYNVDSKLGLQASAKYEDFSVAAQVLSSRREADSYSPTVEWLYGSYKVNNNLTVRAGKMATPVFAKSDYRNVNFSQVDARPVGDIYRMVPIESYTGADLLFKSSAGDVKYTLQPFGGKFKNAFWTGTADDTYHVEGKNMYGMAVGTEYGNFSGRLVYTHLKLSLDDYTMLNDLFGTMRLMGMEAAANKYDIHETPSSFTGLALNWDDNDHFVNTEYAVRKTKDSFLANSKSYSVLTGGRYGSFTPYIGYSRVLITSDQTNTDVPTTGPAAALGIGLQTVLDGPNTSQYTFTMGSRYDIPGYNAALKLQWDRIQPTNGTDGLLAKTQAGFDPNKAVNVFTANVDFLF